MKTGIRDGPLTVISAAATSVVGVALATIINAPARVTKLSAIVLEKPEPLIVTAVPAGPATGEISVIDGPAPLITT